MRDRYVGGQDEKAAIVSYLRGGGEYIRGQWFSWDSEMGSYAKSFADYIEKNCHHSNVRPAA